MNHELPIQDEENVQKPSIQDYEDVQEQLARSRSVLHLLRFRIRCCWLAIVLLFGGCMLGPLLLFPEVEWMDVQEMSSHGRAFSDTWILVCIVFVRNLLWYLRVVIVALAPLINDRPFTISIVVSDVFLVLVQRLVVFYVSGLSRDGCFLCYNTVLATLYYGRGLVFLAFGAWSLLDASPSQVQKRVWLGLATFATLDILQSSIRVLDAAIWHHDLSKRLGNMVVFVPVLYFALRKQARQRLHGYILYQMDTRAACRGAASLAGLLGPVSPQQALKTARQRFRCLRQSDLTLEMLADNLPNPAYSSLAQPCSLGGCDAFISHSWHDCAMTKWEALQEWSAAFVEENGREPTLWFDRCCIDQSRIEIDLRCLPIFLMGCRRLVVFCGPTYLSRLWCILEIFTYVQVGGCPEDIELIYVMREGFEVEDEGLIEDAFLNFDARQCQCTVATDKQRMLAIIELAFGSFDVFNAQVQCITRQVKRKFAVPHQSTSVP